MVDGDEEDTILFEFNVSGGGGMRFRSVQKVLIPTWRFSVERLVFQDRFHHGGRLTNPYILFLL